MKWRLKPEWDVRLKIDRSFGVFVIEDLSDGPKCCDSDSNWLAHVVGHELDNVTFGHNPVEALEMALDVVHLITGLCKGGREHDWSVETEMRTFDEEGELDRPAIGCSVCDERAPRDHCEPLE